MVFPFLDNILAGKPLALVQPGIYSKIDYKLAADG